jgi:membrane protease YdiL (CAAX protease family)
MLGPMGVREPSGPQKAPQRATAVVSFYAALLLVGFFWHAVAQDSNDVWRQGPEIGLWTLTWTALLGAALGLATVQVFRALEIHMAWIGELHREFGSIFGRPSNAELALIAAASALGEEVFFRGAMLDAWGLWASSLVFALLHIPPRLKLWPWTLSSLILGLVLGWLTQETGNLGAAVAAHFVINLLNLMYITRRRPRITLPGPIRPADP